MVGSSPVAMQLCRVLHEDADLAEAVPDDRRDAAIKDCTAPEIALPAGAWDSVPDLPEDAIGLLLLDWTVLDPVRLALLDGRFTRQLGRYPELAGRLFERAVRRSRRLVVNMAIIHQARVDHRLHLLLWH